MSCNSCAKPFSLLRKEKGCPNCGFSYCSKCLDNTTFVKKLNKEAKVCLKCRRAIESNTTSTRLQPPDAFYKRLAMTSNDTPSNQAVKSQITSKDDLIQQRLKKLKEDQEPRPVASEKEIQDRLKNLKGEVPTTSDAEIQERLAKLRGLPTTSIQNKPVLPSLDLRTEQEQADDLIKQYLEQTKIDGDYKDEFDEVLNGMESRLQKLKETDKNKVLEPEKKIDADPDSEDEVSKIVEKYKARASLEYGIEDETGAQNNEELPFCEICNEDASMRCLGCRYLFCKRCFLEHKDDDDGCNKYEPYKSPQNV